MYEIRPGARVSPETRFSTVCHRGEGSKRSTSNISKAPLIFKEIIVTRISQKVVIMSKSPQTCNVCKAWDVVLCIVVVIIDKIRRYAILMKHGWKLAESEQRGACYVTNAPPERNKKATPTPRRCSAYRSFTGTRTASGLSGVREGDPDLVFKNTTRLYQAIKKWRLALIQQGLKHSYCIGRVRRRI